MINLLLSILFTTSLGLAFKLFEKYKINNFQAIVFNYVSCVITGCVVQQSVPHYNQYSSTGWFPFAVILGCSFLFFFNVMGKIVLQSGVTVMSVANKLSLVIPVALAFSIYNEEITILKIAGIALALIAVVFTSLKNSEDNKHLSAAFLVLPLLLFFGSGMNDSMVKYAQNFYMSDADNAPFNITIFSASSFAGLLILSFQLLSRRKKFEYRSMIAGLLLGIPNYFSMHFLVKALSIQGMDSSVIFPINNIGTVACSALLAFILFKEKLTLLNLVGLTISFIAILLISY